jgi:hypothetical protein
VPLATIRTAANSAYSITSSARASNDGGTAMAEFSVIKVTANFSKKGFP